MHGRFQGVEARRPHFALDANHLRWTVRRGLQLKIINDRSHRALAIGTQVEHDDAVAGLQLGIGSRSARTERPIEIRGYYFDFLIWGNDATNQYVMSVRGRAKVVKTSQNIRKP